MGKPPNSTGGWASEILEGIHHHKYWDQIQTSSLFKKSNSVADFLKNLFVCVCVCVCVCVLFCLFVFTFGSAGSSLPHRRSLLWHSAFSSCRVWNLSSLIRDRTQASCTESAESYPLGHQGSLLQIRSAVGIVLMVLVILTRGTRYSTINTEDLTVTVRQ